MTTEKATPPGIALDNEALDRLEALARTATPQNLDSAQDSSVPTGYIVCPECDGEGSVELTADYCNYDGRAMGVQFYGIGPEHQAAEAFFRAANPATVLALIVQARAAQPQPSAAPGESLCPACQGSGESMCMEGAGPDAYEVPCACPYCNGSGGLLDAYHGLVALLDAERKKYLEACGKLYFAAAPSPNFAARGAEPAGQSIDTPEFRQRFSFMLRGEYADLVAHIDAQLSAARQGHVDAVSTSGEHVEKTPGNEHVEGAPQPTAAPTPHEQEARAAVPMLTVKEAFESVGGWYNGGELGYPSFGSTNALWAYTDKMQRNAVARAQAGMLPVAQTDAARDVLEDDAGDPLYEKAVQIVRAHDRASLSLVQRHLRIGYNRAARLFEAMEAAGVVSAHNENGHRTVLPAAKGASALEGETMRDQSKGCGDAA